jgi:hypothetical protein
MCGPLVAPRRRVVSVDFDSSKQRWRVRWREQGRQRTRRSRHRFPHVALLAMGLVTAIGTYSTLTTVISVRLAVFVIVQGIAQVVALTVLRRVQPDLERPYKMWLYPLPSLIALVRWSYIDVPSATPRSS